MWIAYWRVQSRAQCASSRSRRMSVTQVVPPSVRSMDVRYTTSTSFSVGVTAVTADLDLDEARFPLQITTHIRIKSSSMFSELCVKFHMEVCLSRPTARRRYI